MECTLFAIYIIAITTVTRVCNAMEDWVVDLTDSDLVNIPDISQVNVTNLILDRNNISSVDTFQILPNITRLYINYNLLTEFPNLENISATLRHLYLSDNLIANIASYRLSVLQNLEQLNLNRNLLSTFPDATLPVVDTLRLSSNLIERCPDFQILSPQLERLYITGGEIRSCGRESFSGTLRQSIHLLHLQNAQLASYQAEDFNYFSNLENLDISSSALRAIPNLLLLPKSLKTLSIRSYNIKCSDPMLPWVNVLRSAGVDIESTPNGCFKRQETETSFTSGGVIDFNEFNQTLRSGKHDNIILRVGVHNYSN